MFGDRLELMAVDPHIRVLTEHDRRTRNKLLMAAPDTVPNPRRGRRSHLARMAGNRGDFEGPPANKHRDQTAWLGREDSNLRMAEPKSTQFPLFINIRSEN